VLSCFPLVGFAEIGFGVGGDFIGIFLFTSELLRFDALHQKIKFLKLLKRNKFSLMWVRSLLEIYKSLVLCFFCDFRRFLLTFWGIYIV
jgi:hypothetical protein